MMVMAWLMLTTDARSAMSDRGQGASLTGMLTDVTTSQRMMMTMMMGSLMLLMRVRLVGSEAVTMISMDVVMIRIPMTMMMALLTSVMRALAA